MARKADGGVGNRIIELRWARQMTQGELADALGMSRVTLYAIERGRVSPNLKNALRIARFFGKSVEEVFNLDLPVKPTPEQDRLGALLARSRPGRPHQRRKY